MLTTDPEEEEEEEEEKEKEEEKDISRKNVCNKLNSLLATVHARNSFLQTSLIVYEGSAMKINNTKI